MWFDTQGQGVMGSLSESFGWSHEPPRSQDPHLRVMVRQGLAGMVHWHERVQHAMGMSLLLSPATRLQTIKEEEKTNAFDVNHTSGCCECFGIG